MKVSGIYKWTNPKGRVYVGQSEDLLDRKDHYKYLSRIKQQIRICRSIKKYGIEAHIWEVIELCCIGKLDERERHWQDHYDVIGPMGLNCVLKEVGEKRRVLSEETRKRLSTANSGENNPFYGKKHTLESIEKIIKANLGYKHTEETRQKISLVQTGRTHTEESKLKMSLIIKEKYDSGQRSKTWLGKTHSEETRKKLSDLTKARGKTEEHIANLGLAHRKPIIQLDLGGNFIKEWSCTKEVEEILKIHISNCLRNKSKTAGKFKWKYK